MIHAESADTCPQPLKQIFYNLRQDVSKQFPDKKQFQYVGVSSFIFLRFFNAAVLVRHRNHGRRYEHC